MTREEALEWQARWRLVSEVGAREARDQSPADRLRSLSRLRAFARTADLRPATDDERRVWDRFQTLRARLVRSRAVGR